MTYLVDANVLSEPTRAQPNPHVVNWLRAHQEELVVDPIVLGELRVGVLVLPRGRKRTRLEHWFAQLEGAIECLPWDASVGQRWAQLVADLRKTGQALPLLDSMIAATALRHELTVATRNVRHFERAGVDVVNPFVDPTGT